MVERCFRSHADTAVILYLLLSLKVSSVVLMLYVSPSVQASMSVLAQAVLAEVPNQVVSYFKMRGLDPLKRAAPKS